MNAALRNAARTELASDLAAYKAWMADATPAEIAKLRATYAGVLHRTGLTGPELRARCATYLVTTAPTPADWTRAACLVADDVYAELRQAEADRLGISTFELSMREELRLEWEDRAAAGYR